MNKFFQVSASRFRNILGDELYDNHWNDFVSSSYNHNPVLSGSQIQDLENWLVECENSTTGSAWFELLLTEQFNGSFK